MTCIDFLQKVKSFFSLKTVKNSDNIDIQHGMNAKYLLEKILGMV